MVEKQTLRDTSESIKLTKNTKGFSWEIKINEINVERIEKINNEMINKFGGETTNANNGDY